MEQCCNRCLGLDVYLPQVAPANVIAGAGRNVVAGTALPSRSSMEVGLNTDAIFSLIFN